MGRLVKDWKPELVAEAEVAPHRYLWSGTIGADGERLAEPGEAETYDEFKARVPYKVGEVVYVDRGGRAYKARILWVLYDRDRFGDRRELYRVQYETASGHWSKLWENAWSGFVQRGYKLAGLAPDVLD